MKKTLLGFSMVAATQLIATESLFFSDRASLTSPRLAASRDAQVKISFLTNEDGTFSEPALGGSLGIYYRDLSPEDLPNSKAFSVAARILYVPRFEFGSSSFDLWNTDFVGGPQFSYKSGNNVIEFWPYHQSSHKGPDVTASTGPSINYSFESLRLLYFRYLLPDFRVYAGIDTIVRGDPRELLWKSTLHLGGDWHVSGLDPALYIASDVESKEFHGWTLNGSLQIGYELGDLKSTRRQHVFVNFYHGTSPQGQFYKTRETNFSAGIAASL